MTPQHNTEPETIEDVKKRLEIISRIAREAFYDWDIENNELGWSENIIELYGYSRNEIEPTIEWWESNLHPDDHDRVMESLTKAVETGQEAWTEKYRFKKKGGDYMQILDTGQFIKNEEGKTIRMVGLMEDQTDVLESNKKLTETNEDLSLAVKSMVGRERRIIDLKKEVAELEKKIAELEGNEG